MGYRRLHDGQAVFDPDDEVRHTLGIVFEQFERLTNARAVLRYFIEHQLKMPRLIQWGPDYGRIVWAEPTYPMIYQVLTSPVYAGVFVYGRRKLTILPGEVPVAKDRRVALEEWDIVVPDTYPAYIDYEQFLRNRQYLHDNNMYNFDKKGQGAAREGRALLQGIILCGRCGRRMTVSHGAHPQYQCRRAQLTYATGQCQAFPVRELDQAIGELVLQAMAPAQLQTTLNALAMVEKERQTLDQHWQLRLERARYHVERAQRQYDTVEPEYRLVARELERCWNEALSALHDLEREYELVRRTDLAPLTDTEQAQIRALAQALPAVWQAPTTQAVDRKRLVRLVITEGVLTAEPPTRSAHYRILWSGGLTTEHRLQRPPIGAALKTESAVIERIQALAKTYPDHRIAEQLNNEGVLTRTGKRWTYQRVYSIRKLYHIPSACPIINRESKARGDGLVPANVAAQLLNVSPSLISLWAMRGVLVKDQRTAASKLWVRVEEKDIARLNGSADCRALSTIDHVMNRDQLSRDAVWDQVRQGHYIAYRKARGGCWEWRLKKAKYPKERSEISHVGCNQ